MTKKRADKYEKKVAVKSGVTFQDLIKVAVKHKPTTKAKKK